MQRQAIGHPVVGHAGSGEKYVSRREGADVVPNECTSARFHDQVELVFLVSMPPRERRGIAVLQTTHPAVARRFVSESDGALGLGFPFGSVLGCRHLASAIRLLLSVGERACPAAPGSGRREQDT